MRTILRNGKVVLPDRVSDLDIVVEDGIISGLLQRGTRLTGKIQEVDCGRCLLFPGAIDPHLHIRLDTGIYRTDDDWDTGTRAALRGGVTTVIDFATQFPGQTYLEAVRNRIKEFQDKAYCDVALHCMVTDLSPTAGRFEDFHKVGVNAVKVYTTYRPNYYFNPRRMKETMNRAAEAGLLVMIHCEDDNTVTSATRHLIKHKKISLRFHGKSRPASAEPLAAKRVLQMAKRSGTALYIVHNSVPDTVKLIQQAKHQGQWVVSETCPQYLFLDDSHYTGPHPERYILQPPLRPKKMANELLRLLEAGSIDLLGTDHCDYSINQKSAHGTFLKTPGGLPGLETFFLLMLDHWLKQRLPLPRLSVLTSLNAARIFGLFPQKGALLPGADADIIVVDPRGKTRIHAKKSLCISGYSPYEGWETAGRVRAVYHRGKLVCKNGRVLAQPRGQYLESGHVLPPV